MIMNAITLDQFHVFVTVVDAGGFSAAARKLDRTQSAITYAVKRLEEEIGGELFDRTLYRPQLSARGQALLGRARRILDEVGQFREQANWLAQGLEAVVTLVVDPIAPMSSVLESLKAFQIRFPTVELRLTLEALGASVALLQDGKADLGLIVDFGGLGAELERTFAFDVQLVPVAAPGHPLALDDAQADRRVLARHTQLVLSDRSEFTQGRDLGVVGTSSWRITDLGVKHAMLLAGMGWGSMPLHMVEDDLASGRLVRLRVAAWNRSPVLPSITLFSARSRDRELGPAARWLHERLTTA